MVINVTYYIYSTDSIQECDLLFRSFHLPARLSQRHRKHVPPPPPPLVQIDTLQQHAQLPRRDLPPPRLGERKGERPRLQLVLDHPPVPVPIQDLHPVAPPVAEHQQMTGERIAPDDVLGHHRQTVETAPHVVRHLAQVHRNRSRKAQHPAGSTAARTACKVASSTPRAVRNRRPLASTNSIPASLAPGASLTRAKLSGPAFRCFRLLPACRVAESRCCHQ